MSARFKHKRMYAVSKDGIGLIAGTMAYSRQAAIEHFLMGAATLNPNAWGNFKSTGYRTVLAKVQVIDNRASRLSSDQLLGEK